MTSSSVDPHLPCPHLYGRFLVEGVEQLRAGTHALQDEPDLVLVVRDDPRRYVITDRRCPHDPARDLADEGRADVPQGFLSCYHKRRLWCLETGASNSDAPPLRLYPSHVDGGRLYLLDDLLDAVVVQLPDSPHDRGDVGRPA